MSKNPVQQLFHQARYSTSATTVAQLPADTGYEVAIVGRSNVGKSSAINAICAQRGLAYASKTPGRTQMINFFQLDEERRLVDLPGYGYARVPQAIQQTWRALLEGYLQRRSCLRGIVLLMDSRHPLKAQDEQLIRWGLQLPLHIVLTKADKLSRGASLAALHNTQRACAAWTSGNEVSWQLFSVLKRQGIDELQDVLAQWLAYKDG
jgi:GTP-binding protein